MLRLQSHFQNLFAHFAHSLFKYDWPCSIWLKSYISLASLYWHVVMWEIWRSPITVHVWVTMCHEYILQCYDKFPYDHFFLANWISRSLESSSVTFSLDDTYGHLHVTCARVSSDLPCLYISGEQVRKMILICLIPCSHVKHQHL
jgi:hypothetical protein